MVSLLTVVNADRYYIVKLLLLLLCEIVCNRPSYALQSIRKKIENENPHVAKFALLVSINFKLLQLLYGAE